MTDFRTVLAFVLMFVIYVVFLMPKTDPNAAKKVENSAAVEQTTTASKTAKSSSSSVASAKIEESKIETDRIQISNALVGIEMNPLGGVSAVRWTQFKSAPKSDSVVKEDFTNQRLNRMLLSTSLGNPAWSLASSNENSVRLVGKLKDNVEVERKIELTPDTYVLNIVDSLKNKGAQTLKANLTSELYQPSLGEHETPSFFQRLLHPQNSELHEAIVFQDGAPVREVIDKSKKNIVEHKGVFTTVGFSRKYFFLGLVPKDFSFESTKLIQNDDHSFKLELSPVEKVIAPGETSTFRYAVYLGPKEIPELEKADAELGKVVDYGSWIGPISRFLLMIMHFFYSIIPNYGIAIILLTILVKLALYPLAYKSAVSMRKLQQVQPKMVELKNRYKDDKARLNAEMMNLYRTEKVNPVGGCLPLLLQMPVFFALYRVFYASIELRHAPFFGWIHDLSSADPYLVTPILMTGLMWLQQKLTPQPPVAEENEAVQMQRTMMKWMPIVFGSMMLFLPAGLTLYFLVSALISILQQLYLNKHLNLKFPLQQKTA